MSFPTNCVFETVSSGKLILSRYHVLPSEISPSTTVRPMNIFSLFIYDTQLLQHLVVFLHDSTCPIQESNILIFQFENFKLIIIPVFLTSPAQVKAFF